MLRPMGATKTALAALGLCVALSQASVDPAFAQAIDTTLWVTNGTVFAVVRSGNTLYIGGEFTQIGPATGGGVPLDAASGAPESDFPKVAGTVFAVVPDGAGGWYIGGNFTGVGGVTRRNIARILADKSVSSWNPNANNLVYALAVSGTTVYAGGSFTGIGGQGRNRVAALDAATGLATVWSPNADNSVYALAVSGETVYAGGNFASIGGQARGRIAALDATTGLATIWNPNANSSVYALAVSGTTVYAGGTFATIGGQTRRRIAALDATTGLATGWNPNANVGGMVLALAVSGTTVYAGGTFSTIGGQARNAIAALDSATGLATQWNPNANFGVDALAVSGTTIYAGGTFTSIGGQARSRLAALDATSALATAWNPDVNNHVRALAVSGVTVYAGGSFTSMGGQVRNRIAALDVATGIATAWDPNANGIVRALAVSGATVRAGGEFTSIGGQTRNRIAALDATTALATAWNPNANGPVHALAASGAAVYAGGDFTGIGGQTRNYIAALDAATGLAGAWNPDPDSTVHALAVSGTVVYAGGEFTDVGGQTRNYIAALDATSGLATTWDPNANNTVDALAVSGTTVYAGGYFTSIGGQARTCIAALDATSGLATAWDPNANGRVFALAVSGATVYAGGYLLGVGEHGRGHVAAIDAASGLVCAWNPNANSHVFALAVSGTTVYAGGIFSAVGLRPQAYIAAIAAAPAVTAVVPSSGGNTGPVTVTVLGSGLPGGTATKLWHAGQADIFGTGVVVAADGLSLTASFDLTGAAIGTWDVAVMTPDAQMAVLPGGFTVEAVEAPQLRVDVVGPALIRGSRRAAFDLVLQNPGNTDALDVPLWIAGIPGDAAIGFDFPLASPPRDGGEPDWGAVPSSFPGPGGRYVALVIPRVPPGTLTRRVLLTVPGATPPFQLVAALTPPWADGATLRACLADGGVIANPSCMGTWLTAIDAYLDGNPQIAALSGIGMWAKIAWQCEGATTLPDAVAKAEQVLGYLVRPVEEIGTVAESCGEVLAPRWRDTLRVSVVTSLDPNEKLGAHGPVAGQQALPYSVRFENLASATAPAQQVVVVDALDPLTLDAGLVSLGAITFGDVRLEPPPGLTSYATQVDLRPGRNLLLNVGATLDRVTAVLSWYFVSIDPATGQPPTDPLEGFLPPNVVPPEGEGSVLFTVMPLAELPSGTLIGNRAAITFDEPPAMNTPDWLITLDNAPPASRVLPLADYADSASFTVCWEAMGAPPDVRDFTIYVAEDGGAYRVWRLNTVATADTLVPRGDHQPHSYCFYSVARDLSGNIEAAPMTADAQTISRLAVQGEGRWTLALAGARPNPTRGEIRAHITLPGRERATLELLDVAGRRVLRREVGSLGPGSHVLALGVSPRLRPGLYFLRLAQGGRVLSSRVAMVW